MTETAEHETQEAAPTVEDEIAAQMTEESEQTVVESGGGEQPSDDDAPDAVSATAPTDEPDEDEQPPEQQEQQADTEALSEATGKKLDALQKHVARKMGDILGEDVTLFEVCEVCSYTNTPGWRLSGPYPPEVEAAVRGVLGMHGLSEYKTDTYSRVCDVCDGLGRTSTGSRVQGQETQVCVDCKSRGWLAVGPERGGAPLVVSQGDQITNEANGQTLDVIEVQAQLDTPEMAALRADGWVLVPPFKG